ncbi:MAG: transferrin-binding protein-like solute binding protein [Maritimibacter sp.]
MTGNISTATLMILALGLAGCGTISDVIVYSNLESDLQASGETPAEDMPKSGTATFTGKAIGGTFAASTSTEVTHAYIGDASLTAEFNALGGTMTGTVSNMTGAGPTESGISDVEGTIDISNGVIAGSSVSTTYSGDLTLNGQEISVAGNMDGDFYGAEAEGVLLSSGINNATVDGDPYFHQLKIAAD